MSEGTITGKPAKRQYKVYYGSYTHTNKRHPLIRFKGNYLTDLNFKIGDRIEVTMESGRIVITKGKPKNV